jgi:hypothetical protein
VGDEIAARADTLHADHAEADLTVDAFLARVREAPYEAFDRRWNWAVGDICHELDGCTDSRPYRLEGFGEVGATN